MKEPTSIELDKAIVHVVNNPDFTLEIIGSHGAKALLVSPVLIQRLRDLGILTVTNRKPWDGEP